MRICVIFNPSARGDKARRFRALLHQISARADLQETRAKGEAQRLAAAAVQSGFDTLVAAGGDGTVHEVLNGMAEAPDGLTRTRLGVLPLGTVNVWARERQLPVASEAAWSVILQNHEIRQDLPWVEWDTTAGRVRRYFVQLAGTGLDARAINLVSWRLKQRIGSLAYIVAGLKALTHPAPLITVSGGPAPVEGRLVLLGNGRFYGGGFTIFPEANPHDGLLNARVFPRTDWVTLVRSGPTLLARKRLPAGVGRSEVAASFTLTAKGQVPFELDGETAGELPATFGLIPSALRVLAPRPPAQG